MGIQPFNIALVDDDEDDRFMFIEAIEELKIVTNLLLFENGQDFIDSLERGLESIPKLIFLDLNMPIKNGLDCLQYVRKNKIFDNVFIAIYSTSSSEKDTKATFVNGANMYITKPNNFSGLKKTIEKAIKTCTQTGSSKLDKKDFVLKL